MAQDAAEADAEVATYDLHIARLQMCLDFVVLRDAAYPDTVDRENVGDWELDEATEGGIDVNYGRIYGYIGEDGEPVRTIQFFADDSGGPRTRVGCHLPLDELEQPEAQALVSLADRVLETYYQNEIPYRQLRRSGRSAYCMQDERPIQLSVRLNRSGNFTGLSLEDIIGLYSDSFRYACLYEVDE